MQNRCIVCGCRTKYEPFCSKRECEKDWAAVDDWEVVSRFSEFLEVKFDCWRCKRAIRLTVKKLRRLAERADHIESCIWQHLEEHD